MKTLENLNQNKIYVLGVSGGPDSMALMEMCRLQNLTFVVAHMNYQKRDSALRDENIVCDYCKKYDIPCFVEKQNKACVGNFQAFAREERYAFYKRLIDQYHGEAVLLAHHLDDHLETYMMQKQRNSHGEYYGIKDDTYLYGCRIIRPLMRYTKQDLLAYCIEHHVSYGFDESNFSNDYTRNRIRHTYIDHMTRNEKEQLAKEIQLKNEQLESCMKKVSSFLNTWEEDVETLQKQDKNMMKRIIRTWIYQKIHIHISEKLCTELSLMVENKNNCKKNITSEYGVYKEYGRMFVGKLENVSYRYQYDSIQWEETPYFKITKKGKSVEALTLQPNDFPITIRNVQKGDVIQLRFGKKKIHRWFIDRKIPSWERKKWPVVENARGDVILVPQIGCDISHFSNNPNIFVVK